MKPKPNGPRFARSSARPGAGGSPSPRAADAPAKRHHGPPWRKQAAEAPAPATMEEELAGALLDVFAGGHRLDKVIERRMRAHREWASSEREQFVSTLHLVVREWRLRWNRAGLPDSEYLTRVNLPKARQVLAARPLPPEREQAWPAAIRASFPDWLDARAQAELGAEWPVIRTALNRPAPVFLRVNPLRTDTAQLAATLAGEGCPAEPVPGVDTALRLKSSAELFRTNAFRDGWFEVQDIHSQRVAALLDVKPGQRVIDACAGAGGKSLHLAALMRNKGRIIALDTADWKLAELRRRAARAGVDNLEARVIEDSRGLKRLYGTADRVLIDVPCSGLGVLRRNPDARWKLAPEDLDRLLALQANLLRDYRRLVKAGGCLVYATCSILPSENQRQVAAFLAEHPGWTLEEELVLRPGDDEGDGFYAARLRVV